MTGEGVATNPLPCSVWIPGTPAAWAARRPTRLMGKNRVWVETTSMACARRKPVMARRAPGEGQLMTSAMGRWERPVRTRTPSSVRRPGESEMVRTHTRCPCSARPWARFSMWDSSPPRRGG